MAEAQELRVQPHDLVAEQSVLGAIFINPEKLITVREFIEADDFYKYSHRVIFKAMVTLSDRNDAIDATTVRTILDDQDDLQNIGDPLSAKQEGAYRTYMRQAPLLILRDEAYRSQISR